MKRAGIMPNYFSKGELILWGASVALIIVSFFAVKNSDYLTLAASLVGATSLIFNAKGNPIGQVLIVAFSIMYGIISLSYKYYGEIITYLGMTAPMAVAALVSWIRNPYNGKRAEVRVNRINAKEMLFALCLTAGVTVAFYFILKEFHTANLIPSTISVATSFAAAYLTIRRSALYAVLYAMNDIVLIVLWLMASATDRAYLSVVVCFAIFLINDIYGFINWNRMHKNQSNGIYSKP